jgi:hypothetical protein
VLSKEEEEEEEEEEVYIPKSHKENDAENLSLRSSTSLSFSTPSYRF